MTNVLPRSKVTRTAQPPTGTKEQGVEVVSHYITAFMNLRQDAIPGRWPIETNHLAPHKPLLLISVFDEFIDNPRKPNLIEPSLQLENRFNSYWDRSSAASDHNGAPVFPLRTTGSGTLSLFLAKKPFLRHLYKSVSLPLHYVTLYREPALTINFTLLSAILDGLVICARF